MWVQVLLYFIVGIFSRRRELTDILQCIINKRFFFSKRLMPNFFVFAYTVGWIFTGRQSNYGYIHATREGQAHGSFRCSEAGLIGIKNYHEIIRETLYKINMF